MSTLSTLDTKVQSVLDFVVLDFAVFLDFVVKAPLTDFLYYTLSRFCGFLIVALFQFCGENFLKDRLIWLVEKDQQLFVFNFWHFLLHKFCQFWLFCHMIC